MNFFFSCGPSLLQKRGRGGMRKLLSVFYSSEPRGLESLPRRHKTTSTTKRRSSERLLAVVGVFLAMQRTSIYRDTHGDTPQFVRAPSLRPRAAVGEDKQRVTTSSDLLRFHSFIRFSQ